MLQLARCLGPPKDAPQDSAAVLHFFPFVEQERNRGMRNDLADGPVSTHGPFWRSEAVRPTTYFDLVRPIHKYTKAPAQKRLCRKMHDITSSLVGIQRGEMR